MPRIADPTCHPEEHSASRPEMNVDEVALVRASRIFRALGDPSRLRLLALLARGEACVTEVSEAEGEEISTISQRLRILRNEGLVSRRRQGKHILYGLADQHVADLIFNALEHANEPRQVFILGRKEEVTAYVAPDSHR
ncbi:MAG: ArsR/SmtB family transcription factor [Bryobacteraceae bacterium]